MPSTGLACSLELSYQELLECTTTGNNVIMLYIWSRECWLSSVQCFHLEVEQHQAWFIVLGWVTTWVLDCEVCPTHWMGCQAGQVVSLLALWYPLDELLNHEKNSKTVDIWWDRDGSDQVWLSSQAVCLPGSWDLLRMTGPVTWALPYQCSEMAWARYVGALEIL